MTLSKTPTGHPAGNALRPLNDCPPPASRGAPGYFFPTRRQASKSRRFTCHGPSRAQNGFEKIKKSLAFSTGSAPAGAMSAPLRPRPARALRWNFRRFESASTIKGQRKPRDRTPNPARHEPASAPQKSVRNPEPGKATPTPSDHVQGKFPGSESIRQSNGGSMGEGRLPQTAAKRPMIDPQKQGARTALPRRSAHMPGKPQHIAQRATMPDRRPPLPHTPPWQRRAPGPSVSNCRPEPKSIDRFN